MSKLIGLFDRVEVSSIEQIDPEDRVFCECLLSEYHCLVNQLNAYHEGLIALDQRLPQLNPAHLEEKENPYIWKNYSKATSWIHRLSFTSVYSRKYIQEALRIASSEFKRRFISYFNLKYTLSIDESSFDSLGIESLQPADWEKIIEKIIIHSGGSLKEAGIKMLKEDFKNKFVDEENCMPEIKNNTITFVSVYMAGTNSKYLSLGDFRVALMMRVLGFFETGKIEIPECIKKSFPLSSRDPIEFSAFRIADPVCRKFAGFKLFKNQRLVLKFVSASEAQEFYRLFVEG